MDLNEPIPIDGMAGDYQMFQFGFDVFEPRAIARHSLSPRHDRCPNLGTRNYDPSSEQLRPGKFRELEYHITDSANPRQLDLVVPYIEYTQFQATAFYNSGMGYKDFLKLLRNYSIGGSFYGNAVVEKVADMCSRIATFEAKRSGGVTLDVKDLDDDEDTWGNWLANHSERLCGGVALVEANVPTWLPKGVVQSAVRPLYLALNPAHADIAPGYTDPAWICERHSS